MAEFRDLEIIKVPGHRGVAANERADQLATAAARGGK
jgi:ribonuclease HI